jgi:hypothetical protein
MRAHAKRKSNATNSALVRAFYRSGGKVPLLRFVNHETKSKVANDDCYAVPLVPLPSAACAAASRAIGTRNGEHET